MPTSAAERPVGWDWRPDARAPQWHRRQPHIVLQMVFDSGFVTRKDASSCMQACHRWRKSIAHSPVLRRSINAYNALGLVLSSGYVTQRDAFNCMRVCRQWHECAHAASKLWHCIDFGQRSDRLANWSDSMPDAIAAKRPKEIAFLHTMVTRPRSRVSAILERNAQLRRLTFCDGNVNQLCALDSLQAPLHSLTVTAGYLALDDAVFAQIVHRAPVLKQLTELHLYANVGDATAQMIAAHFTQLSVLKMGAPLTPAALRHLCADSAHTRTTLRWLALPWQCFRAGDPTKHILAMPNLELLCVRHAGNKWTAKVMRKYKQRHNRELIVSY